MHVTVVDHPLVAERLTRLRDKTTKRAEFRRNLEELTGFLVYEAMRTQPVAPIEIDTPMAPTRGVHRRIMPGGWGHQVRIAAS